MKTVVVTGAGGFIGKSLVSKLTEQGNTVYAILLSERELLDFPRHINAIPIIGDLLNFTKIIVQIPTDVDTVYHLAWKGISSADYKNIEVQKDNIFISICAMQMAASLNSKKFIFVSSNQECLFDYNSIDGRATNCSVYGVLKRCCREICAVMSRNNMHYNSTAFTNVFGIGDTSKRTANLFISKLINGESLDLIEGKNLYDWIYIDDAVNGLIAVGEKGLSGKQYYIGNRELKTFRAIIEEVRDVLAPRAELNFGKYSDTSYTDYSLFDLDALFVDTGFECKSDFKQSVLLTADWVKRLEW